MSKERATRSFRREHEDELKLDGTAREISGKPVGDEILSSF
jgi:hypothetical protein